MDLFSHRRGFSLWYGLEITIKEVKIVGLIPAPGSFLLFI
jgi:hypothetical protein